MSVLTRETIEAASDDELFSLLGKELERRVPAARGTPEFLVQIRVLPVGLRAMAVTYELDVSLALDDLGWHFGNWRDLEFANETADGLDVLNAAELAQLFREAFRIAQDYWEDLGKEGWGEWYHGSRYEELTEPLTDRAWEILKPMKLGLLDYWVRYAREHPEGVIG